MGQFLLSVSHTIFLPQFIHVRSIIKPRISQVSPTDILIYFDP